MKQKIVVTGMGVISPIGNTVNEFWHSVKTGRSGIGPITRFDCAEIPSKIAAEIKDFDPTNYMDVKEAKRMALFTQYAVAAARMAWEDAGLADVTLDNPQRASIFMGNGIGGIEVHTESHKKLFERGPRKLPPMTIPKVIGNEAAGNISMLLGRKIKWDPDKEEIIDDPAASAMLGRSYRAPWTL